MATTTNYGWTTPNDTDLVKDGAAAIRTLGSSIDTTVFANASAGIAKTIVDAKGDIIAATAADTVSRLAVGANNTVLTADSTTATGLKWATPGGGANFTLLNTGGTALSGTTTTISGISGADKIFVYIIGGTAGTTGNPRFSLRLNADSSTIYTNVGFRGNIVTTYDAQDVLGFVNTTNTSFFLADPSNNVSSTIQSATFITGANSSGAKILENSVGVFSAGGQYGALFNSRGVYTGSSVVSSLSIVCASSMTGGTVYVYTSA